MKTIQHIPVINPEPQSDVIAAMLTTLDEIAALSGKGVTGHLDLWEEKNPGATYALKLWASAKGLTMGEFVTRATDAPNRQAKSVACTVNGVDISVFTWVVS
jgi:hypothetical protein